MTAKGDLQLQLQTHDLEAQNAGKCLLTLVLKDDDLVDPEESGPVSPEPGDEGEGDEPSDPQDQDNEAETSFEGDSLQTAQDKIMSELVRLRDSDGEEVAYPFIGKPDRNLYRDYYEIIQHPVSLRSIQQKVRGTDTRKKTSKTTAFPTWQLFEEEVSYIWRNARQYNEDGSDISALAGLLEEYFTQRVAEAKKFVPDPIQVDGHPQMPRLKLKMSAKSSEPGTPKLTLKMAGQNNETLAKDDGPSGVAVDNEALKRQQALVRAGSASQDAEVSRASPRTRSLRRHAGSPKSSATATPSASEQYPGLSATARDLANVVKDETPRGSSQHPEMRASQGLHGLPLDPTSGLSYDGKPGEPAELRLSSTNIWDSTGSATRRGIADVLFAKTTGSSIDASNALLRNVRILTHPSLSLQEDFVLDIPPSSTLAQQSITVTLPPAHHLLTVRPTLAAESNQRQVKLLALMGLHRLPPTGDASTLGYDIQLQPGTTKIDLEAIAGETRGVSKEGPGSDVDYERVTIFFNLLRG
ncbi:hypothetical protein N7492_003588 [Penicillium capsulatum]|uniref:Bromo domain-containing protein n=1 Tax=Penicillium capsulatum TaxID=69766 RepID=A0A9W9ILK0_9EURO|nr:hypothetical protein N7492_003588 [Penicillium capsulatum]KAJ6121829.1 hypothetical protein N7512_004294 [Penicillium capsulatum]